MKSNRLEVYSSSPVFRLFLWIWLVYDCVFGAAASWCMELQFGVSSGPLYPSKCCFFAFSFLQGILFWPVSNTCKYTAFNRDSCLPKVSNVIVCFWSTIALNFSKWHLHVWPQTWFPTFTQRRSALIYRESDLDKGEKTTKTIQPEWAPPIRVPLIDWMINQWWSRLICRE